MIWIFTYLMAIVAANLSVTYFGTSLVIFNSFVLIGFDLFARDKLHEAWHGKHLRRNMALLILSGSCLSVAMNYNALRIAVASFIAFSCTGLTDTVVYSRYFHTPRWFKMNISNVYSAAVDSVVFMVIAFGFPFMWWVAIQNYVAKVVGGMFWTWLDRQLEIRGYITP